MTSNAKDGEPTLRMTLDTGLQDDLVFVRSFSEPDLAFLRFPASKPSQLQTASTDSNDITGHYEKEGAEVNVERLSKDTIRIHVESAVDDHECRVGVFEPEYALLNQDNAVFKGEDDSRIIFRFEKDKVIVESQNSRAYCGTKAAGNMDGVYQKTKRTPDFPRL